MSSSGKHDAQVLDQTILSPEIMELILNHLTLHELKRCRETCRSWNQEVCRVMRNKYTISLELSDDSSQKFYELFQHGKRLKLPTPFRRVHLVVQEFNWTHSPLDFLSDSLLSLSRLSLYYESDDKVEDIDVNAVNTCLVRGAANLTCLTIGSFDLLSVVPGFRTLKFPRLEALSLLHVLEKCTTAESKATNMEVISQLISSSPNLNYLDIRGDHSIADVLEQSNLRRLKKLSISWKLGVTQVLEAVKNVEIDHLTSLTLAHKRLDYSTEHTVLVLQVISKFAESLEYLNILRLRPLKAILVDQHFPPCPILRELQIYELVSTNGFLPRLPALNMLEIGIYCHYKLQAQPVFICSNVRHVKVWNIAYSVLGDPNIIVFRKLTFGKMSQNFPSATHWKFSSQVRRLFKECQSVVVPDFVDAAAIPEHLPLFQGEVEDLGGEVTDTDFPSPGWNH